MKCDRCQLYDATYHVFTDTINIDVCASCVEEARQLDIAIEEMPIPNWSKASIQKRTSPVDLTSWSRTHRTGHR